MIRYYWDLKKRNYKLCSGNNSHARMDGQNHRSIVSTKYGDRPLIDVPPISFQQYAPKQQFQNPRYQMGNLADDLNLPPNAHQTVVPVYPQQPHAQPSYANRPYGNVIQNSNIIPYQNAPQVPPSYQNGGVPGYQHPNTNAGMKDASGEFHHFYGPHGQRIPGPLLNMNFGFPNNNMRYPNNFKIKGKLKRGQMTSIEVVESNISYRDLPDVVIKDLKRLYGHLEKVDVTIVAENGEYHIYATPKESGAPPANPGYQYDTRSRGGGRHAPYTADMFTKRYYQSDDVHYKYDPNARTYYVDPRSYSVASEGRRPRDYKVTEEPRLPVQKPVRRDF